MRIGSLIHCRGIRSCGFGLLIALSACRVGPNQTKEQLYQNGQQYATEGKYTEAIIQFRNAVSRDPKYGEAHFALAEAYLKMFGTVSFNSLTAIVNPYVLFDSIILKNGSLLTVSRLPRSVGREGILCNVAEILDLWFQTPVPFVLSQKLMLVEESVPRQPSSQNHKDEHTQNRICT